MRKLKKIEYLLLEILFKAHNGLDSFTLFKRSKVDFTVFSTAASKLIETTHAIEINNRFHITELGTKSVLLHLKLQSERPWRDVPQEFLYATCIAEQAKPYIPNIRLLDKVLFKSAQNCIIEEPIVASTSGV